MGYLDITYDQSINGSVGRRKESDTHPSEWDIPSKTQLSRNGNVAQLVEDMLNKHEALDSVASIT